MDNQQFLPILLALFPLILGIVGRVADISFSYLKPLVLATISILGLVLGFAVDADPSNQFLAFAVLLAGFCVMLCQGETHQASKNCHSSMIVLGLALGALLEQGLSGRVFLCGLLGYSAYCVTRQKMGSFRTTLVLVHLAMAIILSLASVSGGESLQMFSRLFLAVTFLPLVPFHLPFVRIIDSSKGTLSSLWIVVWLALGLSELKMTHASLSTEMLFVVSLLALATAFFSTLAALGQKQSQLFVAAATVAHVSLIWGLLNIFPNFPRWGIAFGVAVAFVLGGISLAFSFVRQRYGWQIIGKLPGLGSPMPRFGAMMVLLVSFTLFLPMFPTFSGLAAMSTVNALDVKIIVIFIMFFVVWLGGGWFLLQMLHQTAFGIPRSDVLYFDLRIAEIASVVVLLLGAGYSGLLY